MAEMKFLAPWKRLQTPGTDFSGQSGTVGIIGFEADDNSLKLLFLCTSTTAVATSLNAFDDGTVTPIGKTVVFEGNTGKVYTKTAADTLTELT
jgi:hypothetical protein